MGVSVSVRAREDEIVAAPPPRLVLDRNRSCFLNINPSLPLLSMAPKTTPPRSGGVGSLPPSGNPKVAAPSVVATPSVIKFDVSAARGEGGGEAST